MIIKNKLLRDRVFYWLLAFCLISLPFPDYSFNSQAIIAFSIYWVFYNSFAEKKELFLQNKLHILLLSSLFWVPLLGFIYTNNLEEALEELQRKLPFLVYSIILLTVRLKDCRPFVMNQFLFGVLGASLLALAKVGYFKINNLGNYFYYSKFSEFLDKHTTYFSLFIVICLLWLLWLFIHKKANRILLIIGGLSFLYIFYLLSVRISIIALAVGSLTIILSAIASTWKRVLILILIPILLGSFFFTPFFQKRFEPSNTETAQISDMQFRQLHWKAVFETINHNNLLVGYGTRSHRDYLYNKYKEYGLTSAHNEGYNAHNQYLEVFLEFGMLGFILFMCLILYLAWLYNKNEDYFALGIFLVFLIYMLTESIFQRHSGIVIFSILIPLFLSKSSLFKINSSHRNKALNMSLVFILLADLFFSFQQYELSRIDGDFGKIVFAQEGYDRVLKDPFGVAVLLGDTYPATNRFTAHAAMSLYFKNVPLLLQNFMTPLNSVYYSIALAKLFIHILLLFLVAYYSSSWKGFSWRKFLFASVLLAPLFYGCQELFLEYMAIIDPSITYTMFYALPMAFVLIYFLPYYKFFTTGKISHSKFFIIGWLLLLILLVFFGPLPAPLLIIANGSIFSILFFKNFKINSTNLKYRIAEAIKKIDGRLLLFIISSIMLSIYSYYIGSKNSENDWSPKPLSERFSLLFEGIKEAFFSTETGLFFLLVAITVNILLLYHTHQKKHTRYLEFLLFLLLFSLVYIFLLPLGGYRFYRPYIIRRDTLLPILLILLFVWASSSVYLISHLKRGRKFFYISLMVGFLFYFNKKDIFPNYTNVCEKNALEIIANSKEDCLLLPRNCSIATWGEYYSECYKSENKSFMFEYYNIYPRKILYKFEEPQKKK